MASDEEIRLLLSVRGGEAVKDLQENLAYTRQSLDQLRKAYDAGQLPIDEYLKTGGRLARQEQDLAQTISQVEREQSRLNADLLSALGAVDAVDHAMEDLEQASTRAATGMGKVSQAASDTKRSAGGAAQAMLEFGRFTEDVATGGFLGGLNNIPRIFEGIGAAVGLAAGPLAALVTTVSLAATGLFVLSRNWSTVAGLFETRNPIPEATTALERYDGELKKVNKSLDDLREKTSLNYAELERFKQLTAEQADLEAKIAEEQETRANERAHGAHANEADRAAAQGFAKALDEAGGQKAVVERFVREQVQRTGAGEDEIPAIRRAIKKAFKEALAGDQKMIRTIADISAMDRTGTTGIFHTDIARYSPAAQRAEEERKANEKLIAELNSQGHENELAGNLAARKQREDDAKKAAKDLVDALNKQGAEGEKAGLKDAVQAEKERQNAAVQTKAQVTRGLAQEDAAAAGGGYDEAARALLAQVQAQGGAVDEHGRFRKMTKDQQFDYVEQQIEKALHRIIGVDRFGRAVRANRGMGAQQTTDAATRITARARESIDKTLVANGATVVGQQQALIGIIDQNVTALQQQKQQLQHQGQQIRRLQARSRTALKR